MQNAKVVRLRNMFVKYFRLHQLEGRKLKKNGIKAYKNTKYKNILYRIFYLLRKIDSISVIDFSGFELYSTRKLNLK